MALQNCVWHFRWQRSEIIMKTHFILVEDDPQQSETIKSAIEHRFRDVEVELLETESAFYEELPI